MIIILAAFLLLWGAMEAGSGYAYLRKGPFQMGWVSASDNPLSYWIAVSAKLIVGTLISGVLLYHQWGL